MTRIPGLSSGPEAGGDRLRCGEREMDDSEFSRSQALCLDPGGGIERLLEIIRRLRDPETGCPWDVEQTFETIGPYTIEEAYEVADAIRRKSWNELKSELGDLLLHAVYHAEIASEQGLFDFSGVVSAVSDKMVERHPHVFGSEPQRASSKELVAIWEDQKAQERVGGPDGSALSGVPVAMPALARAQKLQKRAARTGFDWPAADGVLDKLLEEARELEEARREADSGRISEEFGDLLFTLVNLARHFGVDAESSLADASGRFADRFRGMERILRDSGRTLEAASLDELDEAWDAAKSALTAQPPRE